MNFLWFDLLALAVAHPDARRRLRLEPAPPPAGRRALLEPVARPRRRAAARPASGATCRSCCSPRRSARWSGAGPAGGRRGRADQSDHDHPHDRRLRQHVLERHPAQPARGRRGRGATFINSQASSTGSASSPSAASRKIVQAPTNDKAAPARRPAEPRDRPADRDRRRHPGLDRRHLGDRPERRQEQSDTSTGTAPDAGAAKGDYAPDIVVLLTDGVSNTGTDRAARRGPAGGRSGSSGLHDRLRHGQRRR
jgi:hypothetical protein